MADAEEYEEDFEEFEEDFEEEDETEVNESPPPKYIGNACQTGDVLQHAPVRAARKPSNEILGNLGSFTMPLLLDLKPRSAVKLFQSAFGPYASVQSRAIDATPAKTSSPAQTEPIEQTDAYVQAVPSTDTARTSGGAISPSEKQSRLIDAFVARASPTIEALVAEQARRITMCVGSASESLLVRVATHFSSHADCAYNRGTVTAVSIGSTQQCAACWSNTRLVGAFNALGASTERIFNTSAQPQYVLQCSGDSTNACIVYGCDDGSISAIDRRERSRKAACWTSAMWAWAAGNVCGLAQLAYDGPVLASTCDGAASAWTISSLSFAPESPSDRGLAVESRLSLSPSPLSLADEEESTGEACVFNGRFAIGASAGSIIHGRRLGRKPRPVRFALHPPLNSAAGRGTTVSAFADGHAFAAGFENSIVALFATSSKRPLWTEATPDNSPAVIVRAVQQLACVVALLENGVLAFFRRNDGELLSTERNVHSPSKGEETCAACMDARSSNLGAFSEPSESQEDRAAQKGEERVGRRESRVENQKDMKCEPAATILLGFANGTIATYEVAASALHGTVYGMA